MSLAITLSTSEERSTDMNMNAPSTTGKRPGKPVRLRHSCDACSIAKIKCTKEKPACSRCMTRGQTCIYGISRRSGRPAQLQSDRPRLLKSTTARTSSISDYTGSPTMHSPAASSDTSLSPELPPDGFPAMQSSSDIYEAFMTPAAVSADFMRSNYVQALDPFSSTSGNLSSQAPYASDNLYGRSSFDQTSGYGGNGYDAQFPNNMVQGSIANSASFNESLINTPMLPTYSDNQLLTHHQYPEKYAIKRDSVMSNDLYATQQMSQSSMYRNSYAQPTGLAHEFDENHVSLMDNTLFSRPSNIYDTFR